MHWPTSFLNRDLSISINGLRSCSRWHKFSPVLTTYILYYIPTLSCQLSLWTSPKSVLFGKKWNISMTFEFEIDFLTKTMCLNKTFSNLFQFGIWLCKALKSCKITHSIAAVWCKIIEWLCLKKSSHICIISFSSWPG